MKLFRSAVRLITRRGAESVTIEDITEAADVGKGTFFNYFDSKEHVLCVLSEIQREKVRATAEMALRRRLPIRAVLQRMMRSLAEEPARNPRIARAFLAAFSTNKSVRATILADSKATRKLIAEVVAAGQKRGEVDRKLRKDAVAAQFLQSFWGAVLLWCIEERPALETAVARVFDPFWRSVAAKGSGKRR